MARRRSRVRAGAARAPRRRSIAKQLVHPAVVGGRGRVELPLPPHPDPRRRLQRPAQADARRACTSASSTGPTHVNADRDRALEFEEILGYHLEQAHRYLAELGPLDDARRRARRPRRRAPRLGRPARLRPRRHAGDREPAPARRGRRCRQADPLRPVLLIEAGEALTEAGELRAADAGRSSGRGPRPRRSGTRPSRRRPGSG